MTERRVLGVHPSYRGLGWALFASAETLLDWGTVDIRNDDAQLLARTGALLDKFQPAVLALEEFERSRRAPRICVLSRAIVARAELRNVYVRRFSRAQIRAVFRPARSRHAIAVAVAARIKALAPQLPAKRRPWESERLNLTPFSAAACAVAYFDVPSLFDPAPAQAGAPDMPSGAPNLRRSWR
jgi:hypothetical protein